MKAILIFDNVNNLLFSKWDDSFIDRMKSFSNPEETPEITDSHNVSQLLSPIITSQRVMAAQFGNTYSSMQCKDGTTIVFDEWLDHVFLIISEDIVDEASRELVDCKTLVQHICGQNINLLHSAVYQKWLKVLLESRGKGDSIAGASGVIGESGATGAALNALKSAAKDVKCAQHYHLSLIIGDKLLSLYSSRGSEDLTPPDIILLSLQAVAAQEYWRDCPQETHLPWLSQQNSAIVYLCAGGARVPCAPHSLHLAALAPRVLLAVLIDMDIREVGAAAQQCSQALGATRRLLLQRGLDLLPAALDALDAAVKKTIEALRKNKANASLCARLATRALELRKSCTTTTALTPETCAAALNTAVDSVLELLRPDIPSLDVGQMAADVRQSIAPYIDFLTVKASRYFSLGSYVDDFPGLVHFVYVDRTAGRFVAPDLADCADIVRRETITKHLSRSLALTREGYCAATWRAGALHACAVLWWERGGAPARPRALHVAAVRALPPPGDMLGAFYRQLTELAFPGETGVGAKELVCLHLGLLPAATAVQQARRLAHTVYEVAGARDAGPRPQDLF